MLDLDAAAMVGMSPKRSPGRKSQVRSLYSGNALVACNFVGLRDFSKC